METKHTLTHVEINLSGTTLWIFLLSVGIGIGILIGWLIWE